MSVTVNLNNVMPDFLREDMVNADKTFSAGKTAVRTTVAFTAPRAITIPLANSLPAGRQIIIDDEIGAITSTNTLTITAAGSDNINGATTFVMDVPYGVKRLITDGVSKWTTEPGLGYTAEDSANKSLSVNADQASNTKYPSVKAVFDWASGLFQPLLTAVNFGSFVSLLTAKTTPVDADVIDISDSAAGGNSKKLTLLNFYSNYISPKIASAYQTILSIASVSDLNTGTDNAKYTTALGLEGSKYLTQKMGKVTATAAGTNTYTASLTPAITSYGGIGLYINFANANTVTNPTLAVDGLSADGFVQADGSAIAIGSLKGYVFVKHNGTAWQVVDRSVGTTTGTVAAGDDSRFDNIIVPVVFHDDGGFNRTPADNTTYILRVDIVAVVGTISANGWRFRCPRNLVFVGAQISASFTAGTNEATTFTVNNVTAGTSATITSTADYSAVFTTNHALNFSCSANDYIEVRMSCPPWATNPTVLNQIVTLLYK